MNHAVARSILIGVVAGAILITLPSFMILKSVRMLNMQEIALCVLQFILCVIAAMYVAKRKQLIVPAVFIYGFLLLYNALAILCTTLNYGVIAWTGFSSMGLGLIGVAIGVFCTIPPKMTKRNAQITSLVCVTAALIGMSFVYGTIVPLLVIPGAIVFLAISDKGVYTLE